MRHARFDHELAGFLAAVVLTIAIAAAAIGALAEHAALAGVVVFGGSGITSLGIVAACRGAAAARGWPRAATGALLTSAMAASLNLAFWILVLLIALGRCPIGVFWLDP